MRSFLFATFLVLIATVLCLSQGQQENQQPQDQQSSPEKSRDKKNNDKAQQDAPPDSTAFSSKIANGVLSELRDGLEGHSPQLMLSAFDRDKMDAYVSFEDQIQAFFDKYEEFRVHYRIAQSTIEGVREVVLVDFEIEATQRGLSAPPPQHKSAQLRFEFERGKRGWKIVDFRPREFFS